MGHKPAAPPVALLPMDGGGKDCYAHVDLADWLKFGRRIPDLTEFMNWDMVHIESARANHVYLDEVWSTT